MANVIRDSMPALQAALLGNMADEVTYTHGGVSTVISAVPSIPERDQLQAAKAITWGIRVSDLPAAPVLNDTVTRDSKSYRVVGLDFNDYGWCRVTCEEIK